MDKKKAFHTAPYIVILVLGLVIIGLLLYIIPFRYGLNASMDYKASDEALDNPLTGYAPWAENVDECEDSQLVYIELKWADWEPSMGVYNIDALEERCHIQKWKQENKNAVLRFVCDEPDDDRHMDIPNWLYLSTGDGTFYDGKYGRGYCPNYSNEFFMERHALAIKALADYCNQDSFVAYVELGSLGHWGEWHTNEGSGALPMPDAEICSRYILDYSDAFHNALLLTRRNYSIAVEGRLGLYHDMTGDPDETAEWLDWIRNGGEQDTSGKELVLTPVERFWDIAPVGGEMAGTRTMEEMFGKWKNETLECVESTHMTFIGPRCPDGDLKDSEFAQELRERLGYRICVSHLETQYSFLHDELEVYMTWKNAGLAPLYWEWPATMYVYDNSGELTYWETVEIDLRELKPGTELETVSHIPFSDVFRQGFQIGIGITSPNMTQRIIPAMEGEIRDGVRIIYTFEG